MINRPLDHQTVPEDFLAHVQARLGLRDEAATISTLGDWIATYHPGPAALARAKDQPGGRRSAA